MQDHLRIPNRWSARGVIAAATLLVSVAACHSDSGGAGDIFAPTATASPPTSTFATPTLDVTLTATDVGSVGPALYYTTDLSTPTVLSTLYTGPITLSGTTVLKFIAVDASGNESDLGMEGYTFASTPKAMELAASGHGDLTGEPFRHWDEDGEVSASCSRCHTGPGFGDYAMDGTADSAHALPLGFDCDACHDPVPFTLYESLAAYPSLEPVEFPSLVTASLGGPSNMCMTCHQGRESGNSVDETIADVPGGPYTFINIHYYAAAASYFGTETKGGYEYAGLDYVGRNVFPSHEATEQSCVGCHMRGAERNHMFEPDVTICTTCHTGTSFETLGGSPSANFLAINTTKDELLDEIQDYAKDVIGEPIVYGDGYPYFFFDLDADGEADDSEVTFSNRYDIFDEPLLKAAYNYQVIEKDPAGFIHNGTYLRQLVQDSVEDLGGLVSVPAPGRAGFDHDLASKSEQWHLSGHADSDGEPFRHWDEDGEVSASCAKCHTTPGFVDYVADGMVDSAAPLGSLVECKACHTNTDLFADPSTRYDDFFTHPALEPVLFPSGITQTLGDASNLCMTCHQGRESGVSVEAPDPNDAIQSPVDYDSYDFINRHYYAAAAIFYGTDVNAVYELPGEAYAGQNLFPGHGGGLNNCLKCHGRGIADHRFEVSLDACTLCHLGITDFEEIGKPFGMPDADYDGDGTGESFQLEIDGTSATLLALIYDYAINGLPQSTPIVYSGDSYPYWFHDLDVDGVVDPGEAEYPNRYLDFDIVLLRAAFNYKAGQDPCGDIHNYVYTLQSLYDASDFLDDFVINLSPPGIRP